MNTIKQIMKARIKNGENKYFNLLLITGILLSGLTIFGIAINLNNNQDIRSSAEEDPGFCQDKCIGQDRCGPKGPPGDVNYNDPCCEEIRKTGDPGACSWPQRGYCTDDQCASIPEGVSRERCGGPRHSWCNMCRDNKCEGYVDNPTPVPPTVVPPSPTIIAPTAIPPTATSVPTAIPTDIPQGSENPFPTQNILPSTPIYPTYYNLPAVDQPTLTPAPAPFKLNLPNILPPKEKVITLLYTFKTKMQEFFSIVLP